MRLKTAAQLKSLDELVQPHFSNMFLLRPLCLTNTGYVSFLNRKNTIISLEHFFIMKTM